MAERSSADTLVEEAPLEQRSTAAADHPRRRAVPRQAARWYVVHTYSGYEDKVKTNLDQRIKSMDAEDLVFHVVVPSVEEIEIRDGAAPHSAPQDLPRLRARADDPAEAGGHRRASEQDKALSSKAWTVVRNSPGVTGFVGSGTAPTPLEKAEVRSIIKQMKADEPRVKVGFQAGQSVRVIDGPFTDFVGTVEEINTEKGKVKVAVSIFGRETPVELDFLQVERL